MGYVPTFIRDYTGSSIPGIIVQTPLYDAALLLGLGILAGALAFAQRMAQDSNARLSGLYGILKYLVTFYYTLALLQMTSAIVIPTFNISIQLAYLMLGTLIISGILLNLLRLIIKVAVPKEFERKKATVK